MPHRVLRLESATQTDRIAEQRPNNARTTSEQRPNEHCPYEQHPHEPENRPYAITASARRMHASSGSTRRALIRS